MKQVLSAQCIDIYLLSVQFGAFNYMTMMDSLLNTLDNILSKTYHIRQHSITVDVN